MKTLKTTLFMLATLLPVFGVLPLAAQDDEPRAEAFYVWMDDGNIIPFFKHDVVSINYSRTDLNGNEQSDYVVQEVETVDSLYRIPIAQIDSVSFIKPQTIIKPSVASNRKTVYVENEYINYIDSVDYDPSDEDFKKYAPGWQPGNTYGHKGKYFFVFYTAYNGTNIPSKFHASYGGLNTLFISMTPSEKLPAGLLGVLRNTAEFYDSPTRSRLVVQVLEKISPTEVFDQLFVDVAVTAANDVAEAKARNQARRAKKFGGNTTGLFDRDWDTYVTLPHVVKNTNITFYPDFKKGTSAWQRDFGGDVGLDIEGSLRIIAHFMSNYRVGCIFKATIRGDWKVANTFNLAGELVKGGDFYVMPPTKIPLKQPIILGYLGTGAFAKGQGQVTYSYSESGSFRTLWDCDFSLYNTGLNREPIFLIRHNNDYKSDGTVVGVNGIFQAGPFAEAGLTVLDPNFDKLCLRWEAGAKVTGSVQFASNAFDNPEDCNVYQALKSPTASVKAEGFTNLGMWGQIYSLVWYPKFFEYSWGDPSVGGLVPVFSDTKTFIDKYSKEQWASVRLDRAVPFGTSVGFAVLGVGTTKLFGTKPYSSPNEMAMYRTSITDKEFEVGKHYRLYPTCTVFGQTVYGLPSYDFIYGEPKIEVEKDKVEFNRAGGKCVVPVATNMEELMIIGNTKSPWMKYSLDESKTLLTIEVEKLDDKATEKREGSFYLRARTISGDEDNVHIDTLITVIQDPNLIELEVSPRRLEFEAVEGLKMVSIKTDQQKVDLKVSDDAKDWIRAYLVNNTALLVEVLKNENLDQDREGTVSVIVTSGDGKNQKTETINVFQRGPTIDEIGSFQNCPRLWGKWEYVETISNGSIYNTSRKIRTATFGENGQYTYTETLDGKLIVNERGFYELKKYSEGSGRNFSGSLVESATGQAWSFSSYEFAGDDKLYMTFRNNQRFYKVDRTERGDVNLPTLSKASISVNIDGHNHFASFDRNKEGEMHIVGNRIYLTSKIPSVGLVFNQIETHDVTVVLEKTASENGADVYRLIGASCDFTYWIPQTGYVTAKGAEPTKVEPGGIIDESDYTNRFTFNVKSSEQEFKVGRDKAAASTQNLLQIKFEGSDGQEANQCISGYDNTLTEYYYGTQVDQTTKRNIEKQTEWDIFILLDASSK